MADGSAKFEITIAAAMPAGEKLASDLDSISRKLLATGKNADGMARAVAGASSAFNTTSKATAANERSLKKFGGALRDLGGPLGGVGSSVINAADDFGDLAKRIGTTGSVALLAGAAVAALAIALVAATAAVVAWAVGLADANRNAALTQQAVEALDPSIAALRGTFSAVASETGATVPELNALTKALTAAKVSAADMPDALRAAALAEAALGKGGSSDFVAELKAGKRAAGALSKEVASKLGPIVSEKMRGLGAQSERFHGLIANLFGGLNIEPLLTGLKRLVDLFDENTAAGKAIKLIFESVFQPLIDSADKAAIVIEAFALGVIIGALKLYIALKPTIKAISEFFGLGDPTTADTLAMVTKAGELLVPVIAGIVVVFAAITAAAAIAAASLLLPLAALGALVAGAIGAGVWLFEAIVGNWTKITEFLLAISLKDIGLAMMRGLAAGITGGGSEIIAAMAGAAGAAISAAKRALGIASPSKVFAELGGYTAEGFAEGIDGGANETQSAMTAMVEPPPVSPATSQRSAPAGASRSIDLTGAQFTFNGVANAEQATQLFQEMLTRFFEGTADSIGGPEAAPA